MEWWKLWNDGFKENETQSTYFAVIFMFLLAILFGKK